MQCERGSGKLLFYWLVLSIEITFVLITFGFERAGIKHALRLGSSNFPELDSFAEFSTLVSSDDSTD